MRSITSAASSMQTADRKDRHYRRVNRIASPRMFVICYSVFKFTSVVLASF